MNKLLMSLAVVLTFSVAFADDDALPVVATNTPLAKTYTTLPLCRRVEHGASVRKPGGEWQAAEEGKFYPFGTSFRAEKGGLLVVAFGAGATVTVADGSEFGTRQQKIGVESRTISLVRGTVEIKLPDNLPVGMFFVTAPGFLAKNPAGESRFDYRPLRDGFFGGRGSSLQHPGHACCERAEDPHEQRPSFDHPLRDERRLCRQGRSGADGA